MSTLSALSVSNSSRHRPQFVAMFPTDECIGSYADAQQGATGKLEGLYVLVVPEGQR